MGDQPPEYGLEFLLAFDGRIHHLEEGYWIKFEIKRAKGPGATARPVLLVHAARAGRLAARWFRQRSRRSGYGIQVQPATARARSLVPDRERSAPTV